MAFVPQKCDMEMIFSSSSIYFTTATLTKGGTTGDRVCDVLQMAIFKRKRPKGVIVHSDRGRQYGSYADRQLLQQNQLLGSMSAQGNIPGRLLLEKTQR
jgi:transposase InsO family protein